MKISKSTITATIKPAKTKGTTFYKATVDDIIKAYSDKNTNVWIKALFKDIGFDAINFEKGLYGSKVIDDALYICETDGHMVDVDNYKYDPEEMLEDISLADIEDMIQDATPDIIRRHITEYEVYMPDFDKLAIDLLKDGESFSELVRYYQEFEK